MPRATGNYVENTFVKGVVTEFTGLNFPESACTESDNVTFDETGRVTRRLGLDAEPDYATIIASRTDKAVKTFIWDNAGGVSTINLLLLQIGTVLYFYRLTNAASLSAGYTTSLDISAFLAPGASDIGQTEAQFTSGFGKLIVAHPKCYPFYVTYNPDTMAVSGTKIIVKIRDTKGIKDGYTKRLSTITKEHQYNLNNQGWAGSPSPPTSPGSGSGETYPGTPDGGGGAPGQ